MAVLEVGGTVRAVVTGALGLAVLADAVIGFSGVYQGPSWFVGIVLGVGASVVAVVCFAVKVPIVGWWVVLIAAVVTPSTLLYLPNLLLAGWAVAMEVLEVRRLCAPTTPSPPTAGSWF